MTQNHSKIISNYFNTLYPNPKCMLNYSNDFEFLIAVCLSAQTTDIKVNEVTKILFKKYKSVKDLANARINDVKKIIKPLGLSNIKSSNIIELSKALLNKYNGKVPSDRKDLMNLKGVGRKTANLVLSECFNLDTFPVDTHINRISKRLKIALKDDDINTVEEKLMKYFPSSKWNRSHHQFIYFGRDICKSRKPLCNKCKLKSICGNVS